MFCKHLQLKHSLLNKKNNTQKVLVQGPGAPKTFGYQLIHQMGAV